MVIKKEISSAFVWFYFFYWILATAQEKYDKNLCNQIFYFVFLLFFLPSANTFFVVLLYNIFCMIFFIFCDATMNIQTNRYRDLFYFQQFIWFSLWGLQDSLKCLERWSMTFELDSIKCFLGKIAMKKETLQSFYKKYSAIKFKEIFNFTGELHQKYPLTFVLSSILEKKEYPRIFNLV